MIVYVESNFCLELAFQQEEEAHAQEILRLAEAGRLELVFLRSRFASRSRH